MLLGVIPHAVYLGQTEHRLVAMDTVEHEHAEITGAHGHRSAAKRLAAAGAGLTQKFRGLLRHLGVRFHDVVDAPVRDRRRVGRKRRIFRIVEPEGHDFRFVALREGGLTTDESSK